MSPKRIYYGFTTSQQRKLLFETWEATGNIEEACRTARVSVRLFYYWKSRFEKGGYAGLEAFESRVAHKLNYKAPEIEAQVVELRRQNLDWGKARITHEMAKANNWVAVVSPNTVRRMLQDAGLWPESGSGGKRPSKKRSTNR
jgi:transposase